jgi:hypothetical protein
MNWRQDDIFANKKFRHIFLINREENNIKIKKIQMLASIDRQSPPQGPKDLSAS